MAQLRPRISGCRRRPQPGSRNSRQCSGWRTGDDGRKRCFSAWKSAGVLTGKLMYSSMLMRMPSVVPVMSPFEITPLAPCTISVSPSRLRTLTS